MQIDKVVKAEKRDDWRGNLPKEREIKQALFEILKDVDKVEEIFTIIREQREY
jgi:type I restriction enzyme, R subunit